MYTLALFDLDGTLLNTLEDLADATNVALREHGFKEHPIEAYKTYVGNGVYKLVERALPPESRQEEIILKVKASFDAYYGIHSQDKTKPYEGILPLLKKLKENEVSCAVITNKPHAYAVELVNDVFGDLIACTYGQRQGIPTKPDPTGVLDCIEYLKIPKNQCVYIGDSNVDIETAARAELPSIGVLWGFRTKKELLEAGAKALVASPKELERHILE
ncbi:phosphoglycolate phosphatase [Sporanaerobium hydrogeniformans]|uniref:Phosphoglycolate phosphatase n=1 Tax=Sporanaerobium hydrogeniformans TaxID=3072179 RepID=A0AC61DEU1_9FIRM|nr:HAD family hydrolase [Sporanaerobium hydrogeniformans]PHV71679.1 phosphoglycolate phosphatase [Sporanaerobium hydrogeniformans]